VPTRIFVDEKLTKRVSEIKTRTISEMVAIKYTSRVFLFAQAPTEHPPAKKPNSAKQNLIDVGE
jgi:hypothetical protein